MKIGKIFVLNWSLKILVIQPFFIITVLTTKKYMEIRFVLFYEKYDAMFILVSYSIIQTMYMGKVIMLKIKNL